MYKNIKVLNPSEHGFFRYTPADNYYFATELPLIPITFSEVKLLCCEFPLVIMEEGGTLQLMLMTGLKRNSLVDKNGAWKGSYLPAYLRRYPFTLTQNKGSDDIRIAFDIESGLFSSPEGSPLFLEDATPSPALEGVTKLLQAFQNESQITANILKVLKERDLLKPGVILGKKDEAEHKIDGFLIIDKEKVLAQEDTALLETIKNGWMELVELQQLSLGKTDKLQIS